MHSCWPECEKFQTVTSSWTFGMSSWAILGKTCFPAQTGFCVAGSTFVEKLRLHLKIKSTAMKEFLFFNKERSSSIKSSKHIYLNNYFNLQFCLSIRFRTFRPCFQKLSDCYRRGEAKVRIINFKTTWSEFQTPVRPLPPRRS